MAHPLTKFRETQKISQPELADRLGVPRSTVHRWESGKRKVDKRLVSVVSEKTGIPAKELRPDLFEEMEKLFGGAQ